MHLYTQNLAVILASVCVQLLYIAVFAFGYINNENDWPVSRIPFVCIPCVYVCNICLVCVAQMGASNAVSLSTHHEATTTCIFFANSFLGFRLVCCNLQHLAALLSLEICLCTLYAFFLWQALAASRNLVVVNISPCEIPCHVNLIMESILTDNGLRTMGTYRKKQPNNNNNKHLFVVDPIEAFIVRVYGNKSRTFFTQTPTRGFTLINYAQQCSSKYGFFWERCPARDLVGYRPCIGLVRVTRSMLWLFVSRTNTSSLCTDIVQVVCKYIQDDVVSEGCFNRDAVNNSGSIVRYQGFLPKV